MALRLAERWEGGAEIISADSMQLYRGMDIGTAKVPPAARRGIPHHQIDVLYPDQEASVAVYQASARADIAAIHSRHALPIVAGGSGLYVRALLDQIEFPPTDPAVRARLDAEAESQGTPAMYARLAELDPKAASHINPANRRRIVRALEAIEVSGKPFSATLPRPHYYREPVVQIGLQWAGETLEERIFRRSQEMFDSGLLEEVAALQADAAHPLGKTARLATGYAQALAHLRGEITREEAVEATALATRQLARRQRKWFARDARIVWMDGEAGLERLVEAARAEVERALESALEG